MRLHRVGEVSQDKKDIFKKVKKMGVAEETIYDASGNL